MACLLDATEMLPADCTTASGFSLQQQWVLGLSCPLTRQDGRVDGRNSTITMRIGITVQAIPSIRRTHRRSVGHRLLENYLRERCMHALGLIDGLGDVQIGSQRTQNVRLVS